MKKAFISFGSNKGDRSKNVAKALDILRKHFLIADVSSFYNSEPVYTNQTRNFLTGVIKIATKLEPKQLHEQLQMIERQLGRINIARDEDKIIDLDLIYYEKKAIEQPPIVIPHHKAHKRRYVLQAMNDIDPEYLHPKLKKTQKQLLDELGCDKKVENISD